MLPRALAVGGDRDGAENQISFLFGIVGNFL